MVKAVVFDAGGVYLNFNYIDFLNESYKILGIDRHVTKEMKPKFCSDVLRGKMTLEKAIPISLDEKLDGKQVQRIKNFWLESVVPNDEMVKLVKKLKSRYILAVLSNSDECTMGSLVPAGAFKDFDLLIFSHEIGTIKPEQEIYDTLMRKLRIPPEECVFIDDREENLFPAKDMGMKTIHFKNPEQCMEELKNLGVKF